MENNPSKEFISKNSNHYLTGTNIDIFGDDYTTEINPSKFFMHLYNEVPFTYVSYTNINQQKFISILMEKYNLDEKCFLYKHEFSKSKKITEIDWNQSGYLINIKPGVLIETHSYKIVLYYKTSITFEELSEVLELISDNKKKKKHNKKFYMIATSNHHEHGFELRKYKVNRKEVDIKENYNDDFVEIDDIVSNFLNEDKKNGLVLLHGKYGTGKTTYLRHIMSKVNRRFIFLPINLMDAISSPSFLPFISKYKDSVLILEDCEDLLTPREQKTGNTGSLVNLLNLGDGLLSDALSLKIICTFNAELQKIDQAILRKGRLVARYEFKELAIDKAQQIADKLPEKVKIEKPMTLADIYNSAEKDFNEEEKKKLGF